MNKTLFMVITAIFFTFAVAANERAELIHIRHTVIPNGLCDKHKISYHIFDTGVPGPGIVIIAGVHGNEPAGQRAAQHIVDNFDFTKGRFLIVPQSNPVATVANTREVDGENLNRMFPGNQTGNTAQRIAAAITEVIRSFSPCAIIDLHEARLSRTNDADSWANSQDLVNTIVYSRVNENILDKTREAVNFAINAINDTSLIDGQRPFRPLGGYGSIGTSHREFSVLFNVPSFITETGRQDPSGGIYNPLEIREAQQLFLVHALVRFFKDSHCSSPVPPNL